jgi:hypothetical protein
LVTIFPEKIRVREDEIRRPMQRLRAVTPYA